MSQTKEEKRERATKLTFKVSHFHGMRKLIDVPLHGLQARARNKIAMPFVEKGDELEKQRVAICEKHAKKDKDGNAIKEGNNYIMIDYAAFAKELDPFLANPIEIDLSSFQTGEIALMRDLILNSKIDMNIVEGKVYSEICDIWSKA